MPILNAKLSYLKERLNLNEKELNDLLFDYGLEVEELDKDNDVIKIDVTPNRLELLSTYSLAEHLEFFLERKENKFPEIKDSNFKVFVDEKNKRKTVAFILKNVKIDENRLNEAIEFQEKIHTSLFRKRKRAALGIYDLDKIKGNVYFKALKPSEVSFIPLNEEKAITGFELLETKKGKEFGKLLAEYQKEGYWPVFVDESGQILSVPPIINSNDVGNVTVDSKNLFIELSGDDLDYLKKHLPFLIKIFHSIFEGDIVNVEVIYKDEKVETKELIQKKKVKDFNFNPNDYLELNLNEDETKKYLKRVGYIEENDLFIPWYRYDIYTAQDIAEDLIIGYGINKISADLPNLFTIGKELDKNKLFNFLKELMVGLGFLENIGEFLTSNKKLRIFGKENKDILIENSSDENFDTVRTTLLISILEFLSNNVNYPYPQKVFEIGKYYDLKSKKEEYSLAFAWSQNKITFNEAKQILTYVLDRLGVKNYEFRESNNPYFIDGRQAEIFLEGKKIAEIGEVYPKVLLEFNIEIPTIMGEIYLDKIKL